MCQVLTTEVVPFLAGIGFLLLLILGKEVLLALASAKRYYKGTGEWEDN